jgi:hypothetical protein
MAIKNGRPNPLNYFDFRRVDFPARHFHYMYLSKYNTQFSNSLNQWIYHNLNSRYYIGQDLKLDNTNTITYITKIGFEQEKELSFFNIACPLLNQ